jgi:hypothetical protein
MNYLYLLARQFIVCLLSFGSFSPLPFEFDLFWCLSLYFEQCAIASFRKLASFRKQLTEKCCFGNHFADDFFDVWAMQRSALPPSAAIKQPPHLVS